VALATILLAVMTLYLGWQTRAAVASTREIERARRAEVAIADASPLAASLQDSWYTIVLDPAREAHVFLKVDYRNSSDRVVAAISATISSGGLGSRTARRDMLMERQSEVFSLPLDDFIDWVSGDGFAAKTTDELQIVITSFGLLGQKVIQTYKLMLAVAIVEGAAPSVWYQERLQIEPKDGDKYWVDIDLVEDRKASTTS
jgi:hypothetical protein